VYLPKPVSTDLVGRPVRDVALGILELAEQEVKPHSPSLAWDRVDLVRGWIRALDA
jgi:hypothetical protein